MEKTNLFSKIIAIIIVILMIGMIVSVFKIDNKENNRRIVNEPEDIDTKSVSWNKYNIRNSYYTENETIKLDLDGDEIEEDIRIEIYGKYLYINEKEYEINNNKKSYLGNGYKNKYYIVDLNGDGVKEIIHDVFIDEVSPGSHQYTIYNYKKNNMKTIGELTISGNMPNEIYVKNNTIKFEYIPCETEFEKEAYIELNLE